MHIEVQVALNFVISYLYNKLPRRRVNIFGEELEKALKDKFQGHWYPEKPFKGSAFRCLKTGSPVDKVLERAAVESGVPIADVLEHLPQELAVWVDPGEVSYRIGEKGQVKVLFGGGNNKGDAHDERSADREVTKTFNPEAQCFRPIECVSSTLSALSLSPKPVPPYPHPHSHPPAAQPPAAPPGRRPASPAPSPTLSGFGKGSPGSPSPVPPFLPRSAQPLTFTTATFAQTKFGSTKLKTSSKRANRMSPTEFSNYIKQRAMQQQVHPPAHHSPAGRALSPDPSAYYFPPYAPPFAQRPAFETRPYEPRPAFDSASAGQFLGPDAYQAAGKPALDAHAQYYPSGGQGMGGPPAAPVGQQDKLLDGGWPYPSAGQYQHLLVAN
ncbi:unnamed protein product [Phaedon cochleariae]|uniref:Anti-proliferative protein domain-containing protein n=1 Tax=Phaedon cochleariae TaxID=80249 RepID=A0A9P0DF35_PHACE|nr:unnamed protein product [Phaedon cochleariae]